MSGTVVLSFVWNAAGQLDTITRYNGLGVTDVVATTDYTYQTDNSGGLAQIVHNNDSAQPITTYDLGYDLAGRLSHFNNTNLFSVNVDDTVTFNHDAVDQLTTADYDNPADNLDFTYDDNGNRTNGYATGDHNRLASDGTCTYLYDGEGNLDLRTEIASGDTRDFVYDHRNRLTAVIDSAGGDETQRIDYLYDAFDRRIRQTVDADGSDDPVAAVDTFFAYDEFGDLVLELDDAENVSHRYLYGALVDQVLADEDVAGDRVLWLLGDHQNSVRDIEVNDQLESVQHLTYDAFGNITNGETPITRFAYTGQEYDPETGLYYYDARYYDPTTGRFISEDPTQFSAGDPNLYRYVGNSPTIFVDPTGLSLFNPISGARAPSGFDRSLEFQFSNSGPPGSTSSIPVPPSIDPYFSLNPHVDLLADTAPSNGVQFPSFEVDSYGRPIGLPEPPPSPTVARIFGGLQVAGGVGQAIIAGGLAAAPEPSSKFAAVGLGTLALDNMYTGSRSIISGQYTRSGTSQLAGGLASFVVDDPNTAYQFGEQFDISANLVLTMGSGTLAQAPKVGTVIVKSGSTTQNLVNLASPGRTKHILFGDTTGGGHKFALNRLFNNKSKFPARWSNERIMNAVSEVATSPNSRWIRQTGRPGAMVTRAGDAVKFRVEGVFEGVKIRTIIQGNDIITAFPIK